MRLIDTHSHLFLEEFADDLEQVMDRAKSAGIERIYMPNIDSTTLGSLLSVCDKYKGYCFPMVGLHPTSVNNGYRKELQIVKEELTVPGKYVAVGEIGMDLYWDKTFLKEQQIVFDQQVCWALEYNLPIVIHCRDAFNEIYELLSPYKETSLRGIFHSFTGTVDEALRFMEFSNFFFGINGVVTFKKSTLPEVLKDVVPLNRLVMETDSPYLAPVPNRGKRNESAFMIDTMQKVAEIYQTELEEVGEITSNNALNLFGL
ncbi:TatD family deoxyribonuclease [Bacteroidaceae bacterium HV4-6-C5C]|nr:TatD family deoxyribonuclease [Bacteroidaceae bacterium HV4-6-C5C]